ncbi:hypothetical protein [Nonomuraea endophytica]|uniref:hypothetical protein n=1 Tax=Nonomuraea endophytica TaxID=714136 RepID=UPI0037CA80AA
MREKSSLRTMVAPSLLVLVIAAGCGDGGAGHITRASLLAELQRNPGVPFALPRTLPSGYRLTAAETTAKDMENGGRVTVRQAYFDADEKAGGGSLVEVCMEEPAKPDQCGPGKGDGSAVHHLNGVDIVLTLHSGAAQDSNAWRHATFTTNLSEVTWLD